MSGGFEAAANGGRVMVYDDPRTPPPPHCDVCRNPHTYRVEPLCQCGGRHRVCDRCYARWELGPQDVLYHQRRLEVCPDSDEFKAAVALADGP